ncbi:hypothetical protein MINTM001_20550 [Mycobacterium paraintracellulare]|nr:hypothetical protein MINTM001_20550 [Mycobacterium paraintracellulare]
MTRARTSPKVYDGIADFEAHVGEHLGFSDWRQVTQKEIDLFAEATGDHQWIHVDPEKAAAGPYGKTIAHGYLNHPEFHAPSGFCEPADWSVTSWE